MRLPQGAILAVTVFCAYGCTPKVIKESCPPCVPCEPCLQVQCPEVPPVSPSIDGLLTPEVPNKPRSPKKQKQTLRPQNEEKQKQNSQPTTPKQTPYVCHFKYTGSNTYYLSNGNVASLFKSLINYLESRGVKINKSFYQSLTLRFYEGTESSGNLRVIRGKDVLPKSIWDEMFAEKNAKGQLLEILGKRYAAPIVKNEQNIQKERANYICFKNVSGTASSK